MRDSRLLEKIRKYLPILAVLGAMMIGVFTGKDLYPGSFDFRSETPTQFGPAPNHLPLQIRPEDLERCSALVYTSLPPKCKTLEGKFIPLPGTSLFIVVTPQSERK